MIKKKRILILAREAKTYAEILSKFGYIAETARSESDVFGNIREIDYDMIILECERPVGGLTGASIIEYTAMLRGSNYPLILAVTKMSTQQAINYYSGFHADKVMFFSDIESKLVNTVQSMFAAPKDPLPEKRKRRMVKEVLRVLTEEGFKATNNGTLFLAEAITEVIYHPESIKLLTKTVYPDIAERYSTTAAAVERSIRFAVDKVSDDPNSHYIQYWAARLKKGLFPYF